MDLSERENITSFFTWAVGNNMKIMCPFVNSMHKKERKKTQQTRRTQRQMEEDSDESDS